MKPNVLFKVAVITVLLLTVTMVDAAVLPDTQKDKAVAVPADLQEGRFLYSPIYGSTTYLINETGVVNHTWSSAYTPNLDSYMLENGTILYAISCGNGGFQKIAWNGSILWEYHYTRDSSFASHDVVPLPNGNVVMIMQEVKPRIIAIQAGRDPGSFGQTFQPDFLIEVHQTGPTSGDIVWEWHIWDHLIQDFDQLMYNYGVVGDHPELIDINFGEYFCGDWIHMNSVDYNPKYDQILMSAHNFNEVWIIDHSTTTEEAASHYGGIYHHGGDLLYRWGNPESYDRGNLSTKRLFFQHQCTWIKPGLPGAGNILVFANGNNHPDGSYSTIEEFTPPVDDDGEYYLAPGAHYGPENYTWHYRLPGHLYSDIWSGVQRMQNGNTLICSGVQGAFTEVDMNHTIVWTYVNPYPDPAWPSVYRTQYLPPPPPPSTPKLSVIGQITWTDIQPNSIIRGNFQVQNAGDPASRINWTLDTSGLFWGTWTFSPESGQNLTPQDDPVTISYTCQIPNEKNTIFRGILKVQDTDNASDTVTVPVSISTPYTPPHLFPRLWQWITHIQETWQAIRHHQLLLPPMLP